MPNEMNGVKDVIVNVGMMGVPTKEIPVQVPVTVAEVIESAGFTAEAQNKKIKIRSGATGQDNFVSLDTILYDACYILVTKQVKGSR
jgi:hypothetical protein